MNLKVLQLSDVYAFFDLDELLEELSSCEDHVEIKPLYRRDGVYVKGGYCWVEVQGRAFETSDKMPLYYIRTYTNWWKYNGRQIRALEAAIREGMATREQRSIHDDWMHTYDLQQRIRHWGLV